MNLVSRLRVLLSRRTRLAGRYLSGAGIELGALHSPMPLPKSATVTYVDRFDIDSLRAHYPELAEQPLATVDVIDDAETLGTFADGSQDFVIASHVLEHCEDPVSTFGHWLRVLRPGGIAFVAVPNKLATFDSPRPVTSWQHVLKDHQDGPQGSRSAHYLEWSRFVDGKADEEATAHAEALEDCRYSIHFHVWDAPAFREFANGCQQILSVPFSIAALIDCRHEILLVARRTP